MPSPRQASQPFVFYSRLHLTELTGLRADTVPELLEHIRDVPGSCIYHHTHHFLQQHQFSVPSASNDFAFWVTEILGDGRLGEQLSSIDTVRTTTINHLRDQLIETIERQLEARPNITNLRAPEGEAFYFMQSKSFVFPVEQQAKTLREFTTCLRRVSLMSIYYHIFASRLRYERDANDFSKWLAESLGENELAAKIARFEPYAYSLEGLRRKLIEMCKKRLGEMRDEKNSHG